MIEVLKVLNTAIDNEELLYQIAMFIRIEISNSKENTLFATKLGLNQVIISLLNCPSEKIQLETIWTINNIIPNTPHKELIKFKLHITLLKILEHATHKIKEHILLTIASLIEGSKEFKEEMLKKGITTYIEEIIDNKNNSIELLRACSMILHNLFKKDPLPNEETVFF